VKEGAYIENTAGLAVFTSQLLTRGTKKYSANLISKNVDKYGASINAGCNWDGISLSLFCLAEFIEPMLEIFSDCFLNPAFAKDEIERYRKKHLSDIQQKLAQPDYLTMLEFNKAMFAPAPYAHSLSGTDTSIQEIQKKDCEDFFTNLKSENDISIISAGCIEKNYFADYFSKLFSDKKKKDTGLKSEKSIIPQIKKNKIVIADKPNANQTTLRIGKFTVNRTNKDYPALYLVNTIFGGYFQSRLNSVIREKEGLTYGINSGIKNRRYKSNMQISSSIQKESTMKAVKLIFDEMQKISEKRISQTELNRAKNYIMGTYIRGSETIQELSSMAYTRDLYGLPKNYFKQFYGKISELTPEMLLPVQRKYFVPENLIIALGGDKTFLEEQIGKI
jgi:zinc protease